MDQFRENKGVFCTEQFDPITVTFTGSVRGYRVTNTVTYGNPCMYGSFASLFYLA